MVLPSSSAVNLRAVWEEAEMQTSVLKRSLVVRGHKSSVSLEDPFWNAMKEIAGLKGMTLSELVCQIDTGRERSNLSSAIRLFVHSAAPRDALELIDRNLCTARWHRPGREGLQPRCRAAVPQMDGSRGFYHSGLPEGQSYQATSGLPRRADQPRPIAA